VVVMRAIWKSFCFSSSYYTNSSVDLLLSVKLDIFSVCLVMVMVLVPVI
jgi:hypothetical protein